MQRRSLWCRFKSGFTKWRVAFLVFLVIYMFFVVLNVGAVTLQWDEANHLNGAQILLQGHFPLYMQSASFYPPLDDVILVGYFAVAGTSLFTARLVSATFSVLALWLVFEFTSRTFGPKTGLIASILLGSMPGFFWSSRIAMLETMLVFFFSASLMTFYFWLQKHDNKWLVLSGVTLGLGFLTKYQAIITIPAMILGVLFLCRGYIKTKLAKLPLLILCASLIALPWIVISYQAYSTGMLNEWMYAMEIGNPDKALYGMRFGPYATPIFYLIEMDPRLWASHPR